MNRKESNEDKPSYLQFRNLVSSFPQESPRSPKMDNLCQDLFTFQNEQNKEAVELFNQIEPFK